MGLFLLINKPLVSQGLNSEGITKVQDLAVFRSSSAQTCRTVLFPSIVVNMIDAATMAAKNTRFLVIFSPVISLIQIHQTSISP